jgi:hypothetical protein
MIQAHLARLVLLDVLRALRAHRDSPDIQAKAFVVLGVLGQVRRCEQCDAASSATLRAVQRCEQCNGEQWGLNPEHGRREQGSSGFEHRGGRGLFVAGDHRGPMRSWFLRCPSAAAARWAQARPLLPHPGRSRRGLIDRPETTECQPPLALPCQENQLRLATTKSWVQQGCLHAHGP